MREALGSLCPLEIPHHGSCHLEGLRGTLGWRTRALEVILRTAASRRPNSEGWLRQPLLSRQRPPNAFKHKIFFYLSTKATRAGSLLLLLFYAFFFLEGIYICIYLQPCRYLHSQEYSVRNTKLLRKKLLKISSRLQENYFHMVRPESPVLVVQRQLGRVLLPKLRVQKSSRTTGRFRKVGFWCWETPGLPGTSRHP